MALSVLRGAVQSLKILERNCPKFAANAVNSTRKLASITKRPLLDGRAISLIGVRDYSKQVKKTEVKKKQYSSSESEYQSSSESDNENLGNRGESEFWRRKMRTFHGILDVNNDGVISYDDFKLLADRFVQLGHLSDKMKDEFHDHIKDLWENLWGEITPYNLVTVERYLEDMHHVLNDKPLKKKVHGFLPFLFRAIDKDNNGKITVDDFKLFFECLGLKEVDAVFSFRTIDSNGDGKLTRKEFISHGRQFFLTEDPESISKYFWGPLVDN